MVLNSGKSLKFEKGEEGREIRQFDLLKFKQYG